jgi:predicted RNA-binding protein with PIN domain
VEQTVILGRGATRMSSREFWRELTSTRSSGRDKHRAKPSTGTTSFAAAMSPEQYAMLDQLRRKK